MTDAASSDAPDELPADELVADPAAVIDPAPLVGIAPVKPDSPLFSSFAIKPEIIEALKAVGIEHTFAIQELTLPIALAGSDLIGQARTGTGKTLGFGVPMLNRLELPSVKGAKPTSRRSRHSRPAATSWSAPPAGCWTCRSRAT